MTKISSVYTQSFHFDAVLIAEPQVGKKIRNTLKALNLNFETEREILKSRDSIFFVIYALNPQNSHNLHSVSKLFSQVVQPNANKIIYLTTVQPVTSKQRMLFHELGTKFVAEGSNQDRNLIDFMKRKSFDASKHDSIESISAELQNAMKIGHVGKLRKIIADLGKIDKNNEEVNCLLAQAYERLGDVNKTTICLKKVLGINSQNLWAANTLGKLYLNQNMGSKGIEMLERLSLFHDLNSDRLLSLSTAYVNSGDTKNAQRVLDKGKDLIPADDVEYSDTQIKIKSVEGKVEEVLDQIGEEGFSEDMLSFLNMRAVIAARNGDYDTALGFYNQAIEGCKTNSIIESKLFYNKGLSEFKNKKFAEAKDSLDKSMKLGAGQFVKGMSLLSKIERLGLATKQEKDEILDIDVDIDIQIEKDLQLLEEEINLEDWDTDE